jgi:hypothetical protein
MSKLWEDGGSYFTDGEWHDNNIGNHYSSWKEFLEEWEDADDGMNYVVNWSWMPKSDDETWHKDSYYRDGTLMILFVMQRKGFYNPQTIDVCKADEPAVKEYLKTKFEVIRDNFQAVLDQPSELEKNHV